jgi:hypothetical protein
MENATENASVFESQEVVDGCPSNNPCLRITCETPFVCHDIWMTHECRLGLNLTYHSVIIMY